ncbi:phosphatidylglycerol--prolipoprotein diacylglyceryl transferase [Bathymodiolus japonicus methanotrophic gill symbiont]|uniref:prolipoprotein diacylglyceryl transferase n=1 Tax=Bathymodiolus japonicus methanotrophic gill symbiont TaxID=113269 RepID=UPI001B65F0A5|nr:prolipoprotein diacylglyceryl transferase [Bathymodiolus japonicus methanotrophic gill symbiont]GFO71564.1 phosphatidylglycerol--prolipoprotein diacylglyceryl transferase [Bathymodiolus japonicus methanotrophic gill symbiont]
MDYFIWDFDPVLASFKYLRIHWYGAMFALALLSNYLFMHWVYLRELGTAEDVDRLLWYCIGGSIIGARLGHILFYNPGYYFAEPQKIIAIWEGGLASHGGVFGVLISLYIYQRKASFNYFWILDRAAIAASLSGCLVRIGNFLNSEITGTATNAAWAVIFKRLDNTPRHPVQLYEAISYAGIFLFLLYLYKNSPTFDFRGRLCDWFLILIFSTRFILEFYKDSLVHYATDLWISTGQMLSIPFVLVGIYILYRAKKL